MVVDSFLKYIQHEKRYSSHTISSYQSDLEKFSLFAQQQYEIAIVDAEYMHIRSWVVHLMNSGIGERSINRKVSTLKSFYKYLLKKGTIKANPATKVQSLKTPKKLPEFIDRKSIENLLDKIEYTDDYEGIRNRSILEVLYATGIRRSELLNLKDTDVDTYEQTIKVFGKGGKERIVPVHRSLVELLTAYKEARDETFEVKEPYLFLTSKGQKMYPKLAYLIVNRYLKGVTTLDKKSPHILRHTFATHLSNEGADLNAVKELLGHSSLAATQVYTHNTIEKLKEIYKQAHPKS